MFNWPSLRLLVPSFLRKTILFAWLDVLHSQVVVMDDNLVDYRDDVLYKMNHNSQVIYFEKVINDKFDPTNRAIWIETVANRSRFTLFTKPEAKPKRYIYSKWNAATNYVADDFAVEGLFVYKSLSTNTNKLPSANPSDWDQYKSKVYIYKKTEYSSLLDFIVWVPVALTINTDQLKVMVNYYKFADKQYTIQTY